MGLQIESVSVHYGTTRALDQVSFTVEKGVIGLLGPNGAGKSSLLRVIATAQRPDSGEIWLQGNSLNSTQLRQVRRNIGYLPQAPSFYPRYTAVRFLNYIAVLKEISSRSERHAEVHRVLCAVDLEDHSHARIRNMSGGMRQRLALACALLGDPYILVLDEPTVGLDPVQRLRFRELVAGLGQSHLVLISTHQTEDISLVCSRVLVLSKGRLLHDGSTDKLASVAQGEVWSSDCPPNAALASWATGTGQYRNIGNAPAGATLLSPTLDDGYFVLVSAESALDGVRS